MSLALGCGLAPAQETAPFPRQGDYVGSAECIRCHDRQHRRLLAGVHRGILDVVELPGCETCHGPGRAHAEAADNDLVLITLPRLLAAPKQEEFCGRCHQDQIARHGGDIEGLRLAGLGCTECHEVHGARDPGPLPGLRFRARRDAVHSAQPAGSAACVDCHPLRNDLLAASAHAGLASPASDDGCETCHGPGAAHADSLGLARLITRPDRADDGAATCRECHPEVDAERFHWVDRPMPYLSPGLTCASCHRIHQARSRSPSPSPAQTPPAAGGPAAGAPAADDAAAAGAAAARSAAAAIAAGAPAATNRACAQCHVPASCTMPGSTHDSLGGLDVPLDQGCGACHAGGLEHAERAGRRDLVQRLGGASADVQARTCLQCHRDDQALRRARHGEHHLRGVGCIACHGPLHGADPQHVADDAEQSCQRCHPAVVAQFRQPNHHPVPEGRMRCSSCHDVHGDRHRARDLELNEGRCVECHPQYRGPFVFAHQAGRSDGCGVCHVPHGSSNRRLLKQANSQQNCLQCHGDFPAFHDQTPGAVFTDCLRCHTEVHGSNHSRFLFR